MVEVEIRAPIHNEESETIDWKQLALVRADTATGVVIDGDDSFVPLDPVMGITTGKPVEPDDDPEEWARSLPYAYRSGDPVAVVRHDDNTPTLDESEPDFVEPSIPEAPEPVYEDAPTGEVRC